MFKTVDCHMICENRLEVYYQGILDSHIKVRGH